VYLCINVFSQTSKKRREREREREKKKNEQKPFFYLCELKKVYAQPPIQAQIDSKSQVFFQTNGE
jgi:hypothetical protein